MTAARATILVQNDTSLCAVVRGSHEAYVRMAHRVAVRIREFTGVRIVEMDDTEAMRALGDLHLILIGTSSDNAVIKRLQEEGRWQSRCDREGSFEIRAVPEAVGNDRDAIILTGREVLSLKRAVDSFVLRLGDLNLARAIGLGEDDLALPPLDFRYEPEDRIT